MKPDVPEWREWALHSVTVEVVTGSLVSPQNPYVEVLPSILQNMTVYFERGPLKRWWGEMRTHEKAAICKPKRGLRRNQSCRHLDLGLAACKTEMKLLCLTHPVCGTFLWLPNKLIQKYRVLFSVGLQKHKQTTKAKQKQEHKKQNF